MQTWSYHANLSILSINATNQNIKQTKLSELKEEEKLMRKDWAEGQKEDRITAKVYNLRHTVVKHLGDEERSKKCMLADGLTFH